MSYLETLVTRFYEKHDPGKLGDVNHVTGIVSWTRNNGLDALDGKLKGKYGKVLKDYARPDDPPVDSDWRTVLKALEKFYAKHEPTKPDNQIEDIWRWTILKGVFALNEKLSSKYGESLPKKALESWKSRWAPVVEETKSANYGELLQAFFSIHDPAKPRGDIDFLVAYATRHGLDPVNDQLRMNFGVGLEDVQTRVISGAGVPPALKAALTSVGKLDPPPASSVNRRDDLVNQLRAFYAKYEPSRNTPAEAAQFNKVVEYGLSRGLRKLNQALRDKYKDDLDTMRRATIRQSVKDFLVANDPNAANNEAQQEDVVNFAIDNGMGALDWKFKQEYGVGVLSPAPMGF